MAKLKAAYGNSPIKETKQSKTLSDVRKNLETKIRPIANGFLCIESWEDEKKGYQTKETYHAENPMKRDTDNDGK